ncbi:MAG: alpha/beta hydrolase [Deltaproteobacteria bacterium]|nr:MAG: alpha/beta hydrolase [Deltaproteobacteria bacterium]
MFTSSTAGDIAALDRPDVLARLFRPRKDSERSPPPGAVDFVFSVEQGVELGARFFLSEPTNPNILLFHGNGEIASDYDRIAPIYNQLGMSLLVVDYRGYGQSSGHPTATTLLTDSLTVFTEVQRWLRQNNRKGLLIIMGRSLGSAPALEIVTVFQRKIAGLILDSGFARTVPLLKRLGVSTDSLGITEADGFSNFGKIRNMGKPTLIIHGAEDLIIPRKDADILLANCGSERKQLVVAPGCSHNDIVTRCGEAYFQTIRRFVSMLERDEQQRIRGRGFDRRYPRRR